MSNKVKKILLLIIVTAFAVICGSKVYAESDIVVALDPGHGGTESGAVGGNLVEKDLNWKLATKVKEILDKTPGITGVLTKTQSQTMDRETRAINAQNAGADLLVSFHINSNDSSSSLSGAEVYITHNKTQKRYYEYSYKLGTDILSNLRSVGVKSHYSTPKTRVGADWDVYADGTIADYYGIISWPMHKGIPAVLIEHAFINNPYDRTHYLTDAMITKMAQADANAIIKNKELFRTMSIKTDKSQYTIGTNESTNIKCTYSPSNLTKEDFSWTSSNPDVVRVYWDKIRGLKPGTATVTIKSLDGSYTKTVKVTVTSKNVQVVPEKTSYSIGLNESVNIKCTYSPSNLTKDDFSWTSSNPDVVRVYWDKIRGLKPGTAKVTIKSLDGSYTKKINVTVSKQDVKVTPEKTSYSIGLNESINIKCTYSPSNLTKDDFSWTSSNPDVVRVYWDKIRGLKAGKATITIKSLDGSYTKKINVTVSKQDVEITPEKTSYTINKNDTMYIKCNYSPSYLTKNDFSWTSTNPSVVRVYWDKIRGLKPGTAEIIIKSLDNSTEKRVKITVK